MIFPDLQNLKLVKTIFEYLTISAHADGGPRSPSLYTSNPVTSPDTREEEKETEREIKQLIVFLFWGGKAPTNIFR